MPIQYACLINRKKVMVVQCQGTKIVADFADMVVNSHFNFIQWAKKVINIDSERNLTYHDKNTYAVCCISTAYDVKDAEAHAYLQQFENEILNAINHPTDLMKQRLGSVASGSDYNALGDSNEFQVPPIDDLTYNQLESRELKGFFKKLRTSLEKFTRDWNDDESKRDKTYTVFNQLQSAKDDMLDNLEEMMKRDGKIEESLAKGQQLQVTTNRFKKNATAVNRKMKCRYYCYWFWIVFTVLLALSLVISWFAGAFSSKDDN